MKNKTSLAAPFPYFGGKSGAINSVWSAFGAVQNYVEPFAGSAAMLLGAPDGKRIETINDADGLLANFWRAIAYDAAGVAHHADWPVNEIDLFARHGWLVRHAAELKDRMQADPAYFDSKMAGWWCWGLCAWIGDGWCSGSGPWVHDGEKIVKGNAGQGINKKLPHLGGGRGINRQTETSRGQFIAEWFLRLQTRLRDVRVACGDWQRVATDSVTYRNGLTAVFLDPPYTKGAMDYAAGGVGGGLAADVRDWCAANGQHQQLRIVLCGHAGEHDALLNLGWFTVPWVARNGYAKTDEAKANAASETLWCSPACIASIATMQDLFAEAA